MDALGADTLSQEGRPLPGPWLERLTWVTSSSFRDVGCHPRGVMCGLEVLPELLGGLSERAGSRFRNPKTVDETNGTAGRRGQKSQGVVTIAGGFVFAFEIISRVQVPWKMGQRTPVSLQEGGSQRRSGISLP